MVRDTRLALGRCHAHLLDLCRWHAEILGTEIADVAEELELASPGELAQMRDTARYDPWLGIPRAAMLMIELQQRVFCAFDLTFQRRELASDDQLDFLHLLPDLEDDIPL